jgi:hypothetical protein
MPTAAPSSAKGTPWSTSSRWSDGRPARPPLLVIPSIFLFRRHPEAARFLQRRESLPCFAEDSSGAEGNLACSARETVNVSCATPARAVIFLSLNSRERKSRASNTPQPQRRHNLAQRVSALD